MQADFSFYSLPGSFLETPGNQEIRGETATRAHKMKIAPHTALMIYWDRNKQEIPGLRSEEMTHCWRMPEVAYNLMQ